MINFFVSFFFSFFFFFFGGPGRLFYIPNSNADFVDQKRIRSNCFIKSLLDEKKIQYLEIFADKIFQCRWKKERVV